jgi:hypothetical protein
VIIHSKPDRNFTVLPNAMIRDEELSFRARGVLVYLLSMPGDWEVSSERLAYLGREGRDAIRTVMRELINAGYAELRKEQTAAGHWVSHYTISDRAWQFAQPVDNPVDN